MLSDQGSDLVMAEIERLVEVNELCNYSDTEKAQANATLNHLYTLHQLRDIDFECELYSLADRLCVRVDEYTRLHNSLKELHDA